MFDLQKIKRAIASLGSENKKLDLEIEALKRRREELSALPRSKEDLADVVDTWLVDQRAVFLERLKQNISFLITSPDSKPNDDLSIFSARDIFGNNVSKDGALLGLLAPLVRDSLRQAVEELPDYPQETGESWPKREKEIQKLDEKIGDLETKITDLKTSAEQAGIQLSPERELAEPDYSGGRPTSSESSRVAFQKANKS